MLVAGGALLALSQAIFEAPCWSLIFIVALVAWPIWTGQREYALFQHRLALVATTRESSRVRRWFWRGNLTSAMQLVSALSWAAVLLAFVPMLDPWHAGLLAADIFVLTLAARYARSVLEDDVRQEYVELLSRRWVLMALNVAFLAVSFFAIDYFVVGAPDTRGVAWADVAERAYADFASRADCVLVGTIVGSLNAVDSLAWHAAEVLIPSLPGPWLKFVAWLVFLLQAGVIALGYTRLQLGVLALTQRRALRPPESGDVTLTVLLPVIAAIYLLAAYSLRDFDPAAAARAGRTVVQWVNPCRAATEPLKVLEGLKAELHTGIDAARKAEQQHGAAQIDATLNRLFLEVEAGVDNYLDWYFSLVGEYSRLAAWIGARSTDALQQDLQAELEKRLFGSANIRETLSQANRQLAVHAEATLGAKAAQVGQRLGSQVHAEPCWAEALHLPAIPGIERDAHRAATALASGFGAGAAVGTLMAGRLSTAAAARLASQRAFPRAAVVASRYAGKRAGSFLVMMGLGATACAPGGPLALLCGLAAGAITWVAVDQTLIKVDEYRFRDEMRRELLDATQLQRAELARELLADHNKLVDSIAVQMHLSLDKAFVPARQGA